MNYENITQDMFVPMDENMKKTDIIVRPSISFWKDVWRRLKANKVAMGGLVIVLLISIMAIFAPMMAKYSYNETNFALSNAGPSIEHWFGNDQLGRDIWARVWVGARISLTVGLLGAIIPSIIGIVVGGLSGFFGGKIDMLIMRFIDVAMCVPSLIYIILIMIYLGDGPGPIILAFAITGWMGSARSVRGLVLSLKEREFVLAAKTLGASPTRIIGKHLIPNTLGIMVVSMTMAIPAAIFYEAYLSFLGLGIKSPMTSLGQLAQTGVLNFRSYPFQLFIPSMVICAIILGFNLFGDGLRDALDPRLRD